MSLAMRQKVTELVSFLDDSAKGDLINPDITQTELIALLARLVLPPSEGGLGYQLLLTSIRSDHGDDSGLGLHGHSHGYCVDCWPQDESRLAKFIQDCATSNHWVTEIGLGGSSQQFYASTAWGDMDDYFLDNSTDHIHLGTQ